MRIVAFIAHPDYLGQCIGGTVAKHTQKGHEVTVVALTAGELGIATVLYPDRPRFECVAIKTSELEDAAQVLGVRETRVLDFPDSELANTPPLRMAIAGIIRTVTPDILITHWPHDAHPDLRAAGQAVLDACLTACLAHIPLPDPPHFVKRAFAFALPTSIDFVPDVFVDISNAISQKRQALECYPTILAEVAELYAKASTQNAPDFVLAPNMYWGYEAGVLYAEAFKEVKVPGLPNRAVDHLPLL